MSGVLPWKICEIAQIPQFSAFYLENGSNAVNNAFSNDPGYGFVSRHETKTDLSEHK